MRARTHLGGPQTEGKVYYRQFGHILCDPPRYAYDYGWTQVGTDYGHLTNTEEWVCYDELETDGPPYTQLHKLELTKKWTDPHRANGWVITNEWYQNHCKFLEWSVNGFANRTHATLANNPGAPLGNMAELVTAAYAHSNPNTPVVDGPLFLFELRELPRMIRDLGDILLRRARDPADIVGGAFLAYQFGWKPLYSDMLSLLNLQQSLENRLSYFAKLGQGKRIKRTLQTSSWTGSVYRNNILGEEWKAQYEAYAWVDVKPIYDRKVWYSLSIKDPALLPQLRSRREEINHLLGLHRSQAASLSRLWNMVPWTWLIDWFSSYGDWLQAIDGHWSYNVRDMCVMCETSFREEVTNQSTNLSHPITGTGKSGIAKQREVATSLPFPRLSFPALSGRQVGILSALATSSKLKTYAGGGLS